MKTRITVMSVLATGALALGACGGGDDTSSGSTSAGSGSTTSTTASVEAFCQKTDELQALGSTFQSLSPNDIEGAKQAFQQALDKINEMDAVAPAEVKSDVDTIQRVFSDINDAVQGASSPADLQQLGANLSSETQDLQQALANAKAYGRENC